MMEDYLERIEEHFRDIRNSLSSIAGWVIAALVVVVILMGSSTPKNKTTDYSRECQQANTSAQDCTSWGIAKTTYYINKDTQQVFFDGSYGPVAFARCSVVDNKNWTCNDGALNDQNGTITENSPGNMYVSEHFGWFKYWWYRAGL